MTDRPILFSAAMIRALLAGRKSQTRRILKDQPGDLDRPGMFDTGEWYVTDSRGGHQTELAVRFRKGDRLYVRETFSFDHSWTGTKPSEVIPAAPVHYWADGNPTEGDWTKPIPGIHQPRWASRLTLTVTDVRVQRLQECSPQDAIAEGLDRKWVGSGGGPRRAFWYGVPDVGRDTDPVRAYADLWDHINSAGAWAANPWIVALTFTVERRNIDTASAT